MNILTIQRHTLHMWIIQHQTFDTLGIGFLPATDATEMLRCRLASCLDRSKYVDFDGPKAPCLEALPVHVLKDCTYVVYRILKEYLHYKSTLHSTYIYIYMSSGLIPTGWTNIVHLTVLGCICGIQKCCIVSSADQLGSTFKVEVTSLGGRC